MTERVTLDPGQSLAFRQLIEALKLDDSVYSALPESARRAIADIIMPPYTSAERHIISLQEQVDGALKLAERFGDRIRELEARKAAGGRG